MNKSAGKFLICNKGIHANKASSLTDNVWKTLINSGLINSHQYYLYKLFLHEIGGTKKALGKRHRNGDGRPDFGRQSLFDKLKKDKETGKFGAEAAVASTSIPLDGSLFSQQYSRTRTHPSTGNTKQFEICFDCNEIRPGDSETHKKGGLGVREFKNVGDWLIAVNTIVETNDLYAAQQHLIILISGET